MAINIGLEVMEELLLMNQKSNSINIISSIETPMVFIIL